MFSEFLITVRDRIRDWECTTLFTDKNEEAAKAQSLSYYSEALDRPLSDLSIISVYNMALA